MTLADYLNPAAAGGGIEGRAAEVNAALKLPTAGQRGGVAVPWEVIEVRAFTDTTAANDGPEQHRPILQRLFGPGIMDALGVRMDSVPAGRAEWPLITAGVAPAQAKEGDGGCGGCGGDVRLRQPEAEAARRASTSTRTRKRPAWRLSSKRCGATWPMRSSPR